MISRSVIEEILSLAVYAPSGDNSQPWRFGFRDGTLQIFNIPERDQSLYNFRQRGSLIAHGALLENISIISHTKGYDPSVNLFPYKEQADLVSEINFQESTPMKDPLYEYIALRSTNRKPYQKIPLRGEHKKEILDVPKGIRAGEIRLIEEPLQKKNLAKSLSINERLLLENHYIHQVLFSHIRWTEKEEFEAKSGLYVKTLELSPPQRMMFKLFQNWNLVQVLNKFGLSKFLAKQGAKLNDATSALGIIVMPNDSAENFIATGRILQRGWLTTTKLGLCLQPLGAIPYLAQRVFSGDIRLIAPQHATIIKEVYNQIKQIAELSSDQIVTMIFRIGYSGKPSAHSSRLSPHISFSQ